MEHGTVLAWGELIYDAPLSLEQAADYELWPSRDNPDIRERMGVQAQAVGAWESRNHIPTEKRLTRWDPETRMYAPLPAATIERMARQFEIALEFPTVTVRPARPKQHKPPHRDGR